MTKLFKYAFLLFAFVYVLEGCKSSEPATKSPSGKGSVPALSEEQRITLTYTFYNANKEKLTGNLDKAAELFSQCIRIDPKNHAAMYELAQIYVQKKKENDALFFAKTAAQLQPKNIWYQILLAELYEHKSKFDDAAKIYEKLVKENPEKVELYFDWASNLIFAGKTNEAIKVYDQIEQQIGVQREVSIQKEQLFLKQNKVDKAAAELEKLIAHDPDDMQSYELLVDLYQANGQNDKALETIKRMQQRDPTSPHVYLALAEYYRAIGDKEKSFENLKLAFGRPELDSDIKIKVISSYIPLVNDNDEMMKQALELSKILAETHPSEAMANAVYGDFLSMSKKYEEANSQYLKALSIDSKNFNTWQQLLINESQLNNFDSLLVHSKQALELFPNQSVVYLFNGIANSQKKNHEEAVKVFLTGSKMVVDNEDQLLEFYSNLGDNYNALKNYTESDKYYDKALDINPKNVYVLNNYAYYLSLRMEKLDKAETMSKQSNYLTPNNSSFQDTYAWILYKQGKFNDAKTWLEKAFANGGDKSDTILEHYGDVLYKMGDTTQAVEYWQKAKAAGAGSDQLGRKLLTANSMSKSLRLAPVFLIVAIAGCIQQGCKNPITRVNVKKEDKPLKASSLADTSAQYVFKLVRDNEFKGEWVQAKANVDSDLDGDKKSFDITLRIRKDSAIWISITPLLGIEAARVLITPDSLKLLDRIKKQYALSDYKSLKNILHINISFEAIQALLTGNFFGYRNENKFASVYVEDKFYVLSTLSKHKLKRSLEEKDPNKPVIQDMYIDPVSFRIIQNIVEDEKVQKSLDINYRDFQTTDAGKFPTKIETKVVAEKNYGIYIEYTRLSINEPTEFPFHIPPSYEKMQ